MDIQVLISWLFVGLSILAAISLIGLWKIIAQLDKSADQHIKKRNHK